MNQDGVNIAFELMLDEIQMVINQLNDEGAGFFKNGDYSKAQQLGAVGTELNSFRQKLEKLQSEWNRGFDASTRSRINTNRIESRIPFKKKGRITKLAIIFPDGTKINENSAAQTFVNAIAKLGVERVKSLNLFINRVPLVSSFKDKRYSTSQFPCGSYFIITHSSTKQKKILIDSISKKLKEDIKTEIY